MNQLTNDDFMSAELNPAKMTCNPHEMFQNPKHPSLSSAQTVLFLSRTISHLSMDSKSEI